jgi:hypothetical protein
VFAHWKIVALRLWHVERIRLGTPYPDVVERAGELRGQCCLMVDATGVGRPVVNMLRRARVECPIYPATITAGVQLATQIARGMEYGKELMGRWRR